MLEFFCCDANTGVLHFKQHKCPAGLDRQTHMALRREFDGVAQQIDQYLHQAVAIGPNPGGQIRVNLVGKIQLHAAQPMGKQTRGVVHGFAQLEGLGVHRQLARLKLRIVQHIVDHCHQMLTRLLGQRQHFHGFCVARLVFAQQFIEPHDGIHGCAQLMADRGNESIADIQNLLQLLSPRLQLLVAGAQGCNRLGAKTLVGQGDGDQTGGSHRVNQKRIHIVALRHGLPLRQRIPQIAHGQRRENTHHHAAPQQACSAATDVDHQDWYQVQPVDARRENPLVEISRQAHVQ